MTASRQALTHILLIFFAAALCAGVAAGAQAAEADPLEGRRVVEVRFVGNETIPAESITKVISTRVGDALSRTGLDADVRAIYALGYFLNVEAKTEELEEGVRVIFQVRERPLILKVDILGNKSISADDIETAIGLSAGSSVDDYLIDRSNERIEDLYKERGYPFVSVRRETREVPDGMELSYIVSEGPRCKIKKVQVTGNETFSWLKLMGMMETKAEFLFLTPGVYSETQLEGDLLRIKKFYVDEGFLDVRVGRELKYNAEKTKLTVTVQIDEGPRYTVANVSFSGNDVLTNEEIYADLEMVPGQYFTAKGLEADREAALDAYGNLGYIEAQLDVKTVFDTENHTVDLSYDFVENNPLYVGLLRITGNSKTKDKVIRRDASFYPGQLFNRSEMRRTVDRLKGRRFFERVELSLVPGDVPESRDVLMDVTEAATGQFSFGVGVSSNSGLLGTISLMQRNFDIMDLPESPEEFFTGQSFMGAGQQFALRVQPGTEFSAISLEFREPNVLDTDWSFGTLLFARKRDRFDYDEDRVGARLSVGRMITRRLSGEVFLRLEDIEVKNVNPLVPFEVLDVRGRNGLVILGFGLSYDTTNSYFLPSEGYRINGSYEIAGDDFKFHRVIIQASEYWTTHTTIEGFKHILAIRGRAGWSFPIGGSRVPLFERFYAGGAQSIRGFDFRGIGPHTFGVPTGGEFVMVYGAEYTLPLVGSVFRGAVFWDGGGVWKESDDFDAGEIRNSIGLGLRMNVPALGNVPLSFDWAWTVTKEPEDDERVFSFNIGAFF